MAFSLWNKRWAPEKDFAGLKSFMNFLEQATKVYKNKTGINKAGP